MKKAELMSPAGDFVCLDAAIKGGADAVYLGVKGFNMRAGAKNFSLLDLKKVCKICKKNSVKTYLTINTIYFEKELKSVEALILKAANAGIDAFIAWDNGILEILKKHKLTSFLSTQASVANSQSIISYYKNFGITRFVLARECSLDDIKEIRKSLQKSLGKKIADKIEVEVFVHGAMCVSISGRCFLSQFNCGKSANRGECSQPCRREYLIKDITQKDVDFVVGQSYILSPKDLCTLPFLDLLLDAKIDSLKIEGRSRNPEFVYTATKAYRTVIDAYYAKDKKLPEIKKSLMDELEKVFNRGFSDGFFMGKAIKNWQTDCAGNRSETKKIIVGKVVNFYPKISVAELKVESSTIKVGQLLQIEGVNSGITRFNAESMQINKNVVPSAKKGDFVAVKTPNKVKKGDRVYSFIS